MRKSLLLAAVAGLSLNVNAGDLPAPGPTQALSGGVVTGAVSPFLSPGSLSFSFSPQVIQRLAAFPQATRNGNIVALNNLTVLVDGKPVQLNVTVDTATNEAKISGN